MCSGTCPLPAGGVAQTHLVVRVPPGFPVGASLNQLDRIQQPIVSEPGNHENWNPKVHLLRGSHGTRLSFLGLGGWVTHPTSKSSGIIIAFLGLGIMQPATDITIIIIPVLRSVNCIINAKFVGSISQFLAGKRIWHDKKNPQSLLVTFGNLIWQFDFPTVSICFYMVFLPNMVISCLAA